MLKDYVNSDSYEYDLILPRFLHQELKSIPKPYFVSRLFPEINIAICKPLDPPFDRFAISHHGTVFMYQPLITRNIDEYRVLDTSSICMPYTNNEHNIIRLFANGYVKTFVIARLLLKYFYNVELSERVVITYLDGDKDNVHIANLEATIL